MRLLRESMIERQFYSLVSSQVIQWKWVYFGICRSFGCASLGLFAFGGRLTPGKTQFIQQFVTLWCHARLFRLFEISLLQSLIANPIGKFGIFLITFRHLCVAMFSNKVGQPFVHCFPLNLLWIPSKTDAFKPLNPIFIDFRFALLLKDPVFH